MDQRLIDVANTGDVNGFYNLLGEDQFILERIDLAPFVDTPLHIAIVAEKTAFALEIANLKPSFARKLNQDGVSPIHLASTHGNLKIVRKLLSKDHDLCLLEGRGNRIPLHCAATEGQVHVMKALLKDCPDSIGMLTVCKETPLHLAAKNGQVEACKVLLKSIMKLNRWELMDWKDEDENTALDAASGSPEVVELLENQNIEDNTMDQRLIDVANTGDVNDFYNLLGEDKFILERIELAPFVDTPLHIAIVAENTNLAVEIANLKPSFARKLNQAGVSPIHLASKYGNLEILCKLLSKDHELCLLEGRGNKIPLHFAAEAGEVDVMKALLKVYPDSIGMLTVCKETPLHLAVKNGKVEACKVLLKSIKKLNRWELNQLMDWMDQNRRTAQDVVAGSREEMDLLIFNLLKNERRNFLVANATRKVKAWMDKPVTNDSRGAMLVVLAVIITASFQAVVSPPGGVWQDTTAYSNSSNINNANTTSTAAAIAHYAGKAVMGQQYPNFVLINAIGFCASIWATILLTIDIPLMLQLLLMGCFAPMMIIYHLSVRIINPEEDMRGIAFTYVAIVITSIICIYTVARRVSQWRSRDLR